MTGRSEKVLESRKTADDVISTYYQLLRKYPSSILDISMLPVSKEKMKALLKVMHADAINEEQRKRFMTGFIFLCRFQPGVGASPVDGKLLHGNLEENLEANIKILEKWMPWDKSSVAEAEKLLEEWRYFLKNDSI
jgi:hypothetical protein